MTTIAYRGGIMAADRRCSAQDVHQCERTKVEKIGGWLLGVSGDLMHVACLRSLIAEKLEADTFVEGHLGKFEWADDTYMSAIVVSPRHEIYFIENTKAGVVAAAKVGAPFVARGSGRDFALAAMRMGANAYEAVEIAAEFDCHTGDGVDTVELTPIAALSPAPSEEAGKGEDAPEIPEGFKPWPPQDAWQLGATIEYWWPDGHLVIEGADQTKLWSHAPAAYRVLPSEPAAEAKGEAERFSHEVRFVMQDGVTGSGHYETEEEAASHYGHLAADPTVKKAQRNAIVNGAWKVMEELPDQTAGREPEEVGFRDYAPYNIASSSQHAEESARAQEVMDKILASAPRVELGPDTVATQTYMDGDQLAVRGVTASEFYAQPEVDVTPPAQDPLLPPERPPVATPEQLEATGVIDGEAGWWARKLTREPA